MSRGLLTRLGTRRIDAPRSADVELSIVAHLRELLNSRQGASESARDFGVPDFTDCLHNFPGGLHELQQALQEAIERYEPRLVQVSVVPADANARTLTLQFQVRARLTLNPSVVTTFSTRVSPGGRVAIDV